MLLGVDAESRERAKQVMRDLELDAAAWEAALDPGSPQWMRDYIGELTKAYRAGDLDWVLEHSDPRIEIVQPPEFPDGRTYRGLDGVIEALLDWPKEWEDFQLEPKRAFALTDEQFVVLATHKGRSRRVGVEVEAEIVWLFTRPGELVTRWDMFMSVEQALAAANAAEPAPD
jgi:ketosteroid isomerase-like protein